MAFVRDRKSGRGQAPRKSRVKGLLGSALACGLVLCTAPAFAQGVCDRAGLQASTDSYLAAQTMGDTSPMKLGSWMDYMENLDESTLSTGLISKPEKIDFHRSILDTQSCSSFTEMVITDPAHPYVLGALVTARGGQIGGIDVMVTDAKNGWLFNPGNTLKYSQAENWGEIPVADRDSRETLLAAANAYLDDFNDKKVVVPWGTPCERLEGGLYTSKAAPGQSLPGDSCNVGVPSGVKIVDRQYVVDPEFGAVTVFNHLGTNAEPDSHTFRIEHGKIRYVHTITACKITNCGLKLPSRPPGAS
ncbi:MAG TPA: hypothetical protein VIJ94_08825 [Caulobacteraceae bacterium]